MTGHPAPSMTRDSQGHLFFRKCCNDCGKEPALFGIGANLVLALIAHKRGDTGGYRRNLGRWYCAECKPPDYSSGS